MAIRVKGDFSLTLRALARRLGRSGTVRVGYFEDAHYPDGTPVASVAAWNEYGTATAPARPFMRPALRADNKGKARIMARVLRDGGSIDDALHELGEQMTQDVRDSVMALNSPPNAPSTIARKGHDKPLVGEHYQLLERVSYRVSSAEDEVMS